MLLESSAAPQERCTGIALHSTLRPWLQTPMFLSHKPSLSSAFLPQSEERSCGFFQTPSSNFSASQGNFIDTFPVCSRNDGTDSPTSPAPSGCVLSTLQFLLFASTEQPPSHEQGQTVSEGFACSGFCWPCWLIVALQPQSSVQWLEQALERNIA